jgi:hypothetical protein
MEVVVGLRVWYDVGGRLGINVVVIAMDSGMIA